jgi:hypothetical protein
MSQCKSANVLKDVLHNIQCDDVDVFGRRHHDKRVVPENIPRSCNTCRGRHHRHQKDVAYNMSLSFIDML